MRSGFSKKVVAGAIAPVLVAGMMPAMAFADEVSAGEMPEAVQPAAEEPAGETPPEEPAEPVLSTDTKLVSLQVAVGGMTADSIAEKTLKESGYY